MLNAEVTKGMPEEIIGKIIGLVVGEAIAAGFWATNPIISIIVGIGTIVIVAKA